MTGVGRRLIALDPGSVTGWCVSPAEGSADPSRCRVGSVRLPSAGKASIGPAAFMLAERLAAMIAEHRPDLVVFEAPFIGPKLASNAYTARRVYGWPAIIEATCYGADCPVAEIAPARVRKLFCGKVERGDPKGPTKRRARELGFTFKNEHEADACAVWWAALAEIEQAKGAAA